MNLDALIDSLEPAVLCQKQEFMTESNIRKWQSQGIQVNVWVLNSSAEVERFLDWGVDSITSDYPGMVTETLQE